MLNLNDYVQELLANLVEEVVTMYELSDGDMSIEMGAKLMKLGDDLTELLNAFIERNQ